MPRVQTPEASLVALICAATVAANIVSGLAIALLRLAARAILRIALTQWIGRWHCRRCQLCWSALEIGSRNLCCDTVQGLLGRIDGIGK